MLSTFEQVLRLKINFHESELFCFGETQDEVAICAKIFGCEQGQFPTIYLGIPYTTRGSQTRMITCRGSNAKMEK